MHCSTCSFQERVSKEKKTQGAVSNTSNNTVGVNMAREREREKLQCNAVGGSALGRPLDGMRSLAGAVASTKWLQRHPLIGSWVTERIIEQGQRRGYPLLGRSLAAYAKGLLRCRNGNVRLAAMPTNCLGTVPCLNHIVSARSSSGSIIQFSYAHRFILAPVAGVVAKFCKQHSGLGIVMFLYLVALEAVFMEHLQSIGSHADLERNNFLVEQLLKKCLRVWVVAGGPWRSYCLSAVVKGSHQLRSGARTYEMYPHF